MYGKNPNDTRRERRNKKKEENEKINMKKYINRMKCKSKQIIFAKEVRHLTAAIYEYRCKISHEMRCSFILAHGKSNTSTRSLVLSIYTFLCIDEENRLTSRCSGFE